MVQVQYLHTSAELQLHFVIYESLAQCQQVMQVCSCNEPRNMRTVRAAVVYMKMCTYVCVGSVPCVNDVM